MKANTNKPIKLNARNAKVINEAANRLNVPPAGIVNAIIGTIDKVGIELDIVFNPKAKRVKEIAKKRR